ncbi:MAG: HNH endonuclease [Candidatus Aenigmatarchaeota archaeon]
MTSLEIGNKYVLEEFEEIFDTSFGYPVGINYRNPDDGQRFIVLLSKEGGPYSDEIGDSETFHYIGEGLEGDQKRTPRNQALIDAIDESFPIYFFYQSEINSQWEYQGLVEVVDFQRIRNGGRMVFRFTLRRLEMRSFEDYIEAEDVVTKSTMDPSLTEEPEEVELNRKARSSAFSRKVKEQYENSCAVCGSERLSPEGVPEVEAAHIYPKEEGGKDALQNGIALCRLHHWAFDHGWFTITDNLEVNVREIDEVDPPEEVAAIAGTSVLAPKNPEYKPHPVYLGAHRDLHGFD